MPIVCFAFGRRFLLVEFLSYVIVCVCLFVDRTSWTRPFTKARTGPNCGPHPLRGNCWFGAGNFQPPTDAFAQVWSCTMIAMLLGTAAFCVDGWTTMFVYACDVSIAFNPQEMKHVYGKPAPIPKYLFDLYIYIYYIIYMLLEDFNMNSQISTHVLSISWFF